MCLYGIPSIYVYMNSVLSMYTQYMIGFFVTFSISHTHTSTLTRDTDAPGEKALVEAKNKAEKATENFILCTMNTLLYI